MVQNKSMFYVILSYVVCNIFFCHYLHFTKCNLIQQHDKLCSNGFVSGIYFFMVYLMSLPVVVCGGTVINN
jgi:hypothetical protein